MREAGDAATLDDSNPVMRRVVLGLLVVFLLGVAVAAVATVPEHRTSFQAPVFTADGTAVIAVRRDLDQVINSFLAGGGQAFFVGTAAGISAIHMVPRREASR